MVEPCFSRSMPIIAKSATAVSFWAIDHVAFFDESGIFASAFRCWLDSVVAHVAIWLKDGIQHEKHGNERRNMVRMRRGAEGVRLDKHGNERETAS